MSKGTDIFDNIKCILNESNKVHCLFIQSLSKIKLLYLPSDSRTKYNREALVKWLILSELLQVDSVYQSLNSQWSIILDICIDVLYNVKNHPFINWRSILLSQSFRSTKGITIDNESIIASNTPCFLIDDTDIPKRGKCIEMIGRIFSHVTRKYTLGFKSLNLAYWSGNFFVET